MATRPVRVGIFREASRARGALEEARCAGFRRVYVVTDDPVLEARLLEQAGLPRSFVRESPGQITFRTAAIGAVIGAAVGLLSVWLFALFGVRTGILSTLLPLAGLIWGGFIGAMMSRGLTREAQNFFDQELEPGDILVVIDVEGQPAERVIAAERILAGEGAAVPLERG